MLLGDPLSGPVSATGSDSGECLRLKESTDLGLQDGVVLRQAEQWCRLKTSSASIRTQRFHSAVPFRPSGHPISQMPRITTVTSGQPMPTGRRVGVTVVAGVVPMFVTTRSAICLA